MSIEFFLVLLAVVGGMAALAWIYCAIFDFVDWWKKKDRLKREAALDGMPPPYAGATVKIIRFSPMAPPGRYGIDHEQGEDFVFDERQEMFDDVTMALKLPRVVIKGPP